MKIELNYSVPMEHLLARGGHEVVRHHFAQMVADRIENDLQIFSTKDAAFIQIVRNTTELFVAFKKEDLGREFLEHISTEELVAELAKRNTIS